MAPYHVAMSDVEHIEWLRSLVADGMINPCHLSAEEFFAVYGREATAEDLAIDNVAKRQLAEAEAFRRMTVERGTLVLGLDHVVRLSAEEVRAVEDMDISAFEAWMKTVDVANRHEVSVPRELGMQEALCDLLGKEEPELGHMTVRDQELWERERLEVEALTPLTPEPKQETFDL